MCLCEFVRVCAIPGGLVLRPVIFLTDLICIIEMLSKLIKTEYQADLSWYPI